MAPIVKQKVIAITTGGTGGHYFPAKAVSEKLVEDGYTVVVFLDSRAYKYKYIWDKQIKIIRISSLGLQKKNIFSIFKMLFTVGIGFLQAMYFFIKVKPIATLSFGGYSSLPTVMASIIFNIPIVMHEQNAVLGKAHRLFARFARMIALTFEHTIAIPKGIRTSVVGLPVRKEFLFQRNKHKDVNLNAKVICVLGGSLGAKIFSEVIPETFLQLSEQEQKKLVVYHQCREEQVDTTTKIWEKTQVNFTIKPFFNNIAQLLHESDLVIARSGASSIAEINTIGRYAVYIPYFWAAENHQELNAINAKRDSGAEYILEKNFSSFKLLEVIQELFLDSDKIFTRAEISKNSAKIQATQDLCKIIEQEI